MTVPASARIAPAPETAWQLVAGSLAIDATIEPHSPIVLAFFEGYDKAFVIPSEKEPLSGFIECLALNRGDAYRKLSAQFGAYREIVFVARDQGGARTGGANFITFAIIHDNTRTVILTTNLNYIYVEPEFRRRGHLQSLLKAVDDLARRLFTGAGFAQIPHLVFIEQNDPFRLDAASYAADTRVAGLDQFERLNIWLRCGARLVDFPYVQPPLREDVPPDASLVYAVLQARTGTLDSCLLREHLKRFFAISVLKGKNPESDPSAQQQLARLAQMCAMSEPIALLAPQALPAGDAARKLLGAESRPASLRAFLKP